MMVLLKKLNEIQNNSNQQFQELKKQLDEQSKENETLIKNQIELLEMKNTLQELKNEIASLGNRVNQMEERISDIEDRNLEINQKEEERNRRMKNNEREIQELADTIRRGNIRIMGILKGEEKGQVIESIFKQIVDENFPNLRNELELGIQVNRTPNYLNFKKAFYKTHIKIIKNQRQRMNSQGNQGKEDGNC